MATEHMGISQSEVIITDCAPLAVIEDLHPALIVLARVASKTELEFASLWSDSLTQAGGEPNATQYQHYIPNTHHGLKSERETRTENILEIIRSVEDMPG